MPRVAKPLPSFVELSPDGKKVKCNLCAAVATDGQWMNRESLSNHLRSVNHRKNESAQEQATNESMLISAQMLADDAREEQTEFAALNRPELHSQPGVASTSITTTVTHSARKQALWDSIPDDAADFAMELDDATSFEKMSSDRARLERSVEAFGLWDAQRAATDLGFSAGDEDSSSPTENAYVGETSEEEAFLADLLDHATDLNVVFGPRIRYT
ncbi:hypothetical protein BC628DRAFT_1424368 [Trametes gibbosa]|nr:hypothetical protein BC628DRAFT_1424368 [Trametes gibbosa]